MDTVIHTLNARGNIMLEVSRDYFSLTPENIRVQIYHFKKYLVQSLKNKNINYDDLKNALIPDKKKKDIVLVFDSSLIESDWYGNEVFKKIIPIFNKKSSHSILVGDYLGNHFDQGLLCEFLLETLVIRNNSEYKHSTQYYMVYINNLSNEMFNAFDENLKNYLPYIGYADMSYTSRLKTVLSTMLVDLFIKHKNIIIQGHEPDRIDSEDVNISGYPFENSGFVCKSVNSDLYGILLSYKIERPVIDGFKVDTQFSLNAIHLDIQELNTMNIVVDEAKLKYIRDNKIGSLLSAGLENISSQELANEIKQKINSNYIYSMSYNAEYNTSKFNILLEFINTQNNKPVKLLAGIEYIPSKKILRLITLF